jgi:hypothetical protein
VVLLSSNSSFVRISRFFIPAFPGSPRLTIQVRIGAETTDEISDENRSQTVRLGVRTDDFATRIRRFGKSAFLEFAD